jgi:hypothetical protein
MPSYKNLPAEKKTALVQFLSQLKGGDTQNNGQ